VGKSLLMVKRTRQLLRVSLFSTRQSPLSRKNGWKTNGPRETGPSFVRFLLTISIGLTNHNGIIPEFKSTYRKVIQDNEA